MNNNSENTILSSSDRKTIFYGEFVKNKFSDILKEDSSSIYMLEELLGYMFKGLSDKFISKGNGKILFRNKFNYIQLIESGSTITIDMIDMKGKGIEAMLFIILYVIENGFKNILLKAQPQKISDNYEEERELLMNFYSSFGFTIKDKNTGKMFLNINDENCRVILNKIKFYIKNERWYFS